MEKAETNFQKKVTMGVELEGYTILTPSYEISRKKALHRKGVGEKGERFTRDWSIGTEYNSRPFSTIREGFFLLKSGLRKYNTGLYRSKTHPRQGRQIFFVGGWRDRFAGTHIHVSLAEKNLSYAEAKRITAHLHDHIPLLIAMTANSPVWADELTPYSSSRILKGSKKYFRPIFRDALSRREFEEMVYSLGRKTKPPTLEIRVMDSNIPEFVMAAACVIKACVLAALHRKKKTNVISHFGYLRGRDDAARRGMKSLLRWNGEKIPATEYLDRFIWTYRDEFREMDVPHEIWVIFKLLKKGINGSTILSDAVHKAYKVHPQTWQKRFAKRYVKGVYELLSGNSIFEFMQALKVEGPNLSGVWLGRKKMNLL